MAGLHVSKQKLSDLKMVIFGAGSAGVGIADQVRDAIAEEGGISKEDASKQIWYDDHGHEAPLPMPISPQKQAETT